jgi:hypothetical protein
MNKFSLAVLADTQHQFRQIRESLLLQFGNGKSSEIGKIGKAKPRPEIRSGVKLRAGAS